MKCKLLTSVIFLSGASVLYSQENLQKHKIVRGETLTSIARKYNTSLDAIYNANPGLTEMIYADHYLNVPGNVGSGVVVSTNVLNNSIRYLVKTGDTKWGLARRFGVSVATIDQHNPHVRKMLQAGHRLLIVGGVDNQPVNEIDYSKIPTFSYQVQPGETLWGLSKRFDTSVDVLIELNQSDLQNGLKSGQSIKIPSQKSDVVYSEHREVEIKKFADAGGIYEVQAKDTKFGLSRMFNMTIERIEELNPHIVDGLQYGHIIRLGEKDVLDVTFIERHQVSNDTNDEILNEQQEYNLVVDTVVSPSEEVISTEVSTNDTSKIENLDDKASGDYILYVIQPGQTLFGLAKGAGLSQIELLELNPVLNDGVKSGLAIKIPKESDLAKGGLATYSAPDSDMVTSVPMIKSSLVSTLNTQIVKEIAIAMPFPENGYSNMEIDRITEEQISYYRGMRQAIDSIKQLGAKLSIRYFDVGSEKNPIASSRALHGVSMLLTTSENKFAADISREVEKLQIPMVMDVYREGIPLHNHCIVALPNKQSIQESMLKFIDSQSSNTIVVINEFSPVKNFIQEKYPKMHLINVSAKGVLPSEELLAKLSDSQVNHIVMEDEQTGVFLSTSTLLLKESSSKKIHLVLLNTMESIQNSGVSPMRFKVLKMIYPSSTPINYQDKIGNTNENFVRGFDVTFDALLRLFQDEQVDEVYKNEVTEQSKYRFDFTENGKGQFWNRGIYIYQYTDDSDAKLIK